MSKKKSSSVKKSTGIGNNVVYNVENNILTITVDLSKDYGPSKSGKTISIASSQGNKAIEGTSAVMGLNVYKYPDRD